MSEQTQFSKELESIGCVPYNEAAIQFQGDKRVTVVKYSKVSNNICYPLCCFSQLIGTTNN